MVDNVLEGISWSFIGGKFGDVESFRDELLEYQDLDFDSLSLDEICLLAPSVSLGYWCYEGDSQIDKWVEIPVDNNASLSALEFLFKLHNLVVQDLDDIDHHFFEGLVPEKDSGSSLQKFRIQQGS